MDATAQESLENFLDPEVMRPSLIAASIYIGSFEALKRSILDHIRDFYWTGFDGNEHTIDPAYQTTVLKLDKSPIYASLKWLKDRQAIDDNDIETFTRVKKCRNTLAHDLFRVLAVKGLPSDFDGCFSDMIELLRKIEVWWIAYVEIPTNPDFDGQEINSDEIVPGPIMTIQLLRDIALGNEEQSRYYYNELRKRSGPTTRSQTSDGNSSK